MPAQNSSGTALYEYSVASNTWTAITSFPIDHDNNGSCTVSEDGYLYMSSGISDLYRLRLSMLW